MRFFCLHEGFYPGVKERLEVLDKACVRAGLEFILLDSSIIDFSDLPTLTKRDILFNACRGSHVLESLLIKDDVTTFYIKNPILKHDNSDTTIYSILHEKLGFRVPKTIHQITNDRSLLRNYVKYLGGFPLVLKSFGSTRGIGTIKIDSWSNLISVLDYLNANNKKFILREFIKAEFGCRAMVLGDEVIASASFGFAKNDFRQSGDISDITYKPIKLPIEIQKIAVESCRTANTEFGGVDFLVDKGGNYFLLEINFPSGFNGLIEVCNVDIPYLMVNYLKNKSLNG